MLQTGAERVDLVGRGVVARRVVLRGEEDALALAERVLERPDRALPADDEGDHHVREDHDVPQRHHRQGLDHVDLVLVTPEHGLGSAVTAVRIAAARARGGASEVARRRGSV